MFVFDKYLGTGSFLIGPKPHIVTMNQDTEILFNNCPSEGNNGFTPSFLLLVYSALAAVCTAYFK